MSVLVPPFEKAWEFEAESNIDGLYMLGVTAARGKVFFGDKKGTIYAVSMASGTLDWKFKIKKSLKLPLVQAEDLILAVSDDKKLYALDAHNGTKRWEFSSDKDFIRWYQKPILSEGAIYLATKDKILHSVDIETGVERWRFTAGGDISPPAVAHGIVCFGCRDKHAYALDSSNGKMRWSSETEHKDHSRPIITEAAIVIGAHDDVYVFKLDNGAVLWKAEKALTYQSPPILVDGLVVCTRNLITFDLASGAAVKRFIVPLENYVALAAIDGILYAHGAPSVLNPAHVAYFLFAYDIASGKELWQACIKSMVSSTDWCVQNGCLFVGSEDKLIAINAKEFSKRWVSESLPGGFMDSPSRPIIDHSMVFITRGKMVNAFRPAGKPIPKESEKIASEPIYEVEVLKNSVVLPQSCCICCGTPEVMTVLEGKSQLAGLQIDAVPYCKECHAKVTKTFGREKPGLIFTTVIPATFAFRNEQYMTSFMELNRLR